jgi:hypothetical protein
MTLHELKIVREKLVGRRRVEAYRVAWARCAEHHDTQIAKLNSVHSAIQALDAVIAEGEAGQPSIYETSGLKNL